MTKKDSTLTQERLKELLHYNPDTGLFTWLISTSNRVKAGTIAGCQHGNGYTKISVDGSRYFTHRLAWFYMTGEFPIQVDHEDGVRNNNRIKNLRAATNAINSKNHRTGVNNTSGVMGVSWCKRKSKWTVRIQANGKYLNIGYFPNIEDAIAARKTAEIEYGYHENHGRPR